MISDKVSTNAYIVKDTKTYIYAEEAKFKLSQNNDVNILFIVIPKINNNRLKERIEEVINYEEWNEVIWIFTRSNKTIDNLKYKKRNNKIYSIYIDSLEYIFNFIDRIKIDQVAKKYSPCNLVISTHKNTHEHLAAMLKPDKLVLVDSGHRVFSRINKNGYIDYSYKINKKRIKSIIHRLTGLKVFDRKKTDLFTVYSEKIETNHGLLKNNFEHQSHLLESKKTGDDVIWISTPIYTMVKGVIIGKYIEYINATLKQLKINSDNLIYVPHPGKQTEKEIEMIKNGLSCRIDDRDLPIEIKITKYKSIPKVCISPFSSALININKASNGRISLISAWHPEFSYFRFWSSWRNDVEKNSDLSISFIEIINSPPLFNIYKTNENNPIYDNFQDWEKINNII